MRPLEDCRACPWRIALHFEALYEYQFVIGENGSETTKTGVKTNHRLLELDQSSEP